MSKPQNVMLVGIALTAATVRVCTKSLDETQWPETRPTGPRPIPIAPRPRRYRDETLVRLETVSRPRRLDRDHISVDFKDISW